MHTLSYLAQKDKNDFLEASFFMSKTDMYMGNIIIVHTMLQSQLLPPTTSMVVKKRCSSLNYLNFKPKMT